MSSIRYIQCHAKNCRARTNIAHAVYRNNQFWCTEKCANGNNPPEKDKETPRDALLRKKPRPSFNQGYWHLLQNGVAKPQPSLPAMEAGAWD